MRACVQRVASASVAIKTENNRISGKIDRGFLVLLGVGVGDDEEDVRYLAKKVASLRVFEDAEGRMNLNLAQVGGAALVVSQFTLFGDCIKGNRPGFVDAAPPETANRLYERFVAELRSLGVPTETGVFRADMAVSLVNDGPVTLWIDADDRPAKKAKRAKEAKETQN